MTDSVKKTNSYKEITPEQRAKLDLFRTILLEWNEKMNLTGITDPAEIETKHFEDSLSALAAFPDKTPLTLIDVGTGAGFPGIPLAIARPDIQITLVESVNKKAQFLEHVIEKLELKNCTVASARAEEVGQHPDYREKYDIAIARAVALLPILAEYLLPLVKVGGIAVAQKMLKEMTEGDGGRTEIDAALPAIATLGGKLKEVIPVGEPHSTPETPASGQRHLIVIEKISPTPAEYPRRPGMPAKTPIQ